MTSGVLPYGEEEKETERERERDIEIIVALSFSALLMSAISTTLCITNGEAWTLSSLSVSSPVDILSALFSYHSVVVTGAAVYVVHAE